MSVQLSVFVLLAAMCLAGGLGAVTTRNVAHAAIFLLLSLGAVAGVFVLLLAEFLALVQILIYGGAITIVLLFALMLTRLEEFSRVADNSQRPLAAVVALLILGVIVASVLGSGQMVGVLGKTGIMTIGSELFTQWVIPFEIASLILLIALIGAIIISRTEEKE